MEAGLDSAQEGRQAHCQFRLMPDDRIDAGLDVVKKHNALMVGLLWGNDGMPRDVNERAALAVDIIYKANEKGIPNEDIFIDPIVTPISGEINQVTACTEFLAMLQDIAPGCKSTVGLSNVSNGAPDHLRPFLNRPYLLMLEKQGLYSSIVDSFDKEIMALAKGEMPELHELVAKLMAGEAVDMASLSERGKQYVKSVNVLMGKTLFSISWLEQ